MIPVRRPRKASIACPLILVLGAAVGGCTDDSPSGAAASSAGPTSSAPTSSDTSSTASGPEHLDGDSDSLEPGRYLFSFAANRGVQTPDARIDVPDGFADGDLPTPTGGWYVVSPDRDSFLGMWTVGKVQRDACQKPLHDYVDPGPSVADLTEALVEQDSTEAARPEPVVVDGFKGQYVELSSPRDLSQCDRAPALWGDPGERGIYGDRQVDQVWVLDVDGQRLVVDASYGPTSSAAERESLTSMVDSLTFVG